MPSGHEKDTMITPGNLQVFKSVISGWLIIFLLLMQFNGFSCTY